MFRLGTAMYIPAYLTVVLYRPLASLNKDAPNPILMFGMYRGVLPATHGLIDLPTVALTLSTYVLSLLFKSNYSYAYNLFSAIRYCGITFGYTAIAILLNYSELNFDTCSAFIN